MIKVARKLVGQYLRSLGWERVTPMFLSDVFGNKIFPAELGATYKKYQNQKINEYKFGDLGVINLLTEGQTVIDVGANVGLYSMLFAAQVGETGKVYSFEPGPVSYALMCRNIAMNGYENITPVNVGVSSRKSKGSLFLCRSGESDNRLTIDLDSGEERDEIEIDLVCLDEWIGEQAVDFLKIDVQGSEWLVIQGAKKILENNKNIIVLMEFSPACLESAKVSIPDLLLSIRSMGFSIYLLHEYKEMELVSDQQLLGSVGEGKAYSYVDLLCRRD